MSPGPFATLATAPVSMHPADAPIAARYVLGQSNSQNTIQSTQGGNSVIEPLLCARNVALAHAKAARHFRELVPDGQLSVNINCDWLVPRTDADKAATLRLLDYNLHVYADPVYRASMPAWLYDAVPELERFSDSETALLRAARPDYFALNHYSTSYGTIANAQTMPNQTTCLAVYQDPSQAPALASTTKHDAKGRIIGPQADSEWLTVVPWGIRALLNHVQTRYQPRRIIITENGVDVPKEGSMSATQAVDDTFRQQYYLQYLDNVMVCTL